MIVIVILGTTLCGRGGPVDKQGRGVPFVWVTPGALRELFIASAGSRAHAGIVFARVLVDDALRMRCHTACSSQGRARNAQWLPAVALLAPRTATEPVSLDTHRADPRSVDVPNTRAIVGCYSWH